MASNEPHAKRRGWLKNGNPTGDPSTCTPMRCQDAQGRTVQGTSYAQRALPDARRRQHGATHQCRLGPFDAGQLETWPVFCEGEAGGEVASPIAARVHGTVPRYYGIVPVIAARPPVPYTPRPARPAPSPSA